MLTIRTLRQARGWSQYELARRIGVHPQAVYLWEHGRRTPQVAQMRKLGGVFEMCSDAIELVPGGATGAHQDHAQSRAAYPQYVRQGHRRGEVDAWTEDHGELVRARLQVMA